MTLTKERIDTAVCDVVRHLASYTATGSLTDMSKARSLLRDLYLNEIEIATPLYNVAIYIHRNFSDLDGDEGEDE